MNMQLLIMMNMMTMMQHIHYHLQQLMMMMTMTMMMTMIDHLFQSFPPTGMNWSWALNWDMATLGRSV